MGYFSKARKSSGLGKVAKSTGFDNAMGGDFSVGGMGGESGALGEWDYIGKTLDKSNPWLQADKKADEAAEEAKRNARDLYAGTHELNKSLNEADTAYSDTFGSASSRYMRGADELVGQYTSKIDDLQNQAQGQARDARRTYTNSILPGYKDAMGLARTNAHQAMTLQQAGDPNNPIMKSIRDMYDQQGQHARQQGQQDFGVLSALGAQAAQGQFGAAGNPMTAGQMGQIYSANQGQAGDAYSRAQQRMYDLQQQGIGRGFDQSNKMYEYGQGAQDRYGRTIKDLQEGEDSQLAQQGRFRGELGDYASSIMGARSGLNTDRFNIGQMGADITRGNAYAGTGREQNALNQYYGGQQQVIANDLQASTANNASKGQFMSSILGGLMGVAGK